MTEKRYSIKTKSYGATDTEYYLEDKLGELVDGYGDEIYWRNSSNNGLKQIVDLLNEQHEEIEFLYSKMEYLVSIIQNHCPEQYPTAKEILRSCFEKQ